MWNHRNFYRNRYFKEIQILELNNEAFFWWFKLSFFIQDLLLKLWQLHIVWWNEPQIASKWPRGVRHEMSSPAQKLVSFLRIPLKTWVSVCVNFVFVSSCVGSGLASDLSPVQGILPTGYKIHSVTIISKWEKAGQPNPQRQQERKNFLSLKYAKEFYCSGTKCRLVRWKPTNVSEENIDSIFIVEE
jgi:hypothetical protein